jgi:hypothetical protein
LPTSPKEIDYAKESHLQLEFTFRHTFGTILNANEGNPQSHSRTALSRYSEVTMDTYVHAVSHEKRNAQSKVVQVLLPGIRRECVKLIDVAGRATKW